MITSYWTVEAGQGWLPGPLALPLLRRPSCVLVDPLVCHEAVQREEVGRQLRVAEEAVDGAMAHAAHGDGLIQDLLLDSFLLHSVMSFPWIKMVASQSHIFSFAHEAELFC